MPIYTCAFLLAIIMNFLHYYYNFLNKCRHRVCALVQNAGGEESTVVDNDNSLVYDELHLIWKVDKSRQQGQRQKKAAV